MAITLATYGITPIYGYADDTSPQTQAQTESQIQDQTATDQATSDEEGANDDVTESAQTADGNTAADDGADGVEAGGTATPSAARCRRSITPPTGR